MNTRVDDVRASAPATESPSPAASPALSPAAEGGLAFPVQASSPARSAGPWARIPVILLLLAILVLKLLNGPVYPDSPALRAVLTFLFGTLVALVVVTLVGRSFLIRGQPGLLLLGCGMLFFGASGIVATLAGGQDVNLNVTIFNLCTCLGAACHLVGAFLLLRPRRPLPAPGLWLWLGALVVLSTVGVVALAARKGWTAPFFVQHHGGTHVRQFVLCLTITFLVLAALLPGAAGRQWRSPFFQWYRLALGAMAVGFVGALLQSAFGSLLSWTAWLAMCLGGAYMLVAALASVRESRAWGTALEVALQESEERFQALTEASFEGIALTEAGRLIDGNDQLFQMLGYQREELLGCDISALHPPEDRERVLSILRAGRAGYLESVMVRKDGTHILIEARGKPLVYQGRPVRVTAFRDVTARKQAEQALQAAQTTLQAHAGQLEQTVTQRTAKLQAALAELEHFSYAITHDMRAPLRAMEGYAELLSRHCAQCPHPLHQEFFRRIQIATGRMDQLITDSLNYSKAARQQWTREPVNLRALLQGLLDTYPNLLPDQADIVLAAELPAVLGSEAALTQCFGNLLDNAVKFAQPDTRPRIRVWAEAVQKSGGGHSGEGAAQAPNRSRITVPAPRWVRVWVEDNGIGIPKEMQERVFGLFERASTEQEGTGLGLAIVRKLVRRLGGEVGVESEPGQGSRFWVELELAPATGRGSG